MCRDEGRTDSERCGQMPSDTVNTLRIVVPREWDACVISVCVCVCWHNISETTQGNMIGWYGDICERGRCEPSDGKFHVNAMT